MSPETMLIRQATDQDFESIWEIFHLVVRSGDTYAYSPQATKEDAYLFWMPPYKETYVALMNDKVVATYFIKANQPGLGDHVANAAYMVHPLQRGRGIGAIVALHSIEEAKRLGFLAMQFNFVVSTNEPAIKLWKKMGFKTIGITPNGFRHSTRGFVDTYVMYQNF